MIKIPFEDGTLVKEASVTIDGIEYQVTPTEYTGETPLSAYNMNKMQDNIEEATMINRIILQGNSIQEGTPSIDSEAPIESVGDNVNVLPNTATTQTINGVTFTVNKEGSVKVNGTATANTILKMTENLTLEDGEEYKLSGCPKGGSSTSYCMVLNQYYSSASHFTEEYGNGATFTYNVLSANSNSIYIKISSGVTVNNLIFKPKIEKGSKVTSYSPYGQGSIGITMGDGTTSETKSLYTQQPFRAIGDVEDRFVKVDGVWYEEHNIYRLILDGTESWGTTTAYDGYYRYSFKLANCYGSTNYVEGMNTHFTQRTTQAHGGYEYLYLQGTEGGGTIYVQVKDITTLDDFKAWLTKNNVEVIYPLTTSELIPCTPEQVEVLNDIYSAYGEGMTNIICNDEIEPVIEIVKETKETVQSENDKAISALLERVSQLEDLVASIQSTTVEEG